MHACGGRGQYRSFEIIDIAEFNGVTCAVNGHTELSALPDLDWNL